MTDAVEINWPEQITISRAKKLAKTITKRMGIAHSRALHAIAVRYGFKTWISCRAALETDAERAEKMTRDMKSQQRRARKWSEGNARRAAAAETLAMTEPGWVGRSSPAAVLDPGMRPVDVTAAAVAFHPRKI